MKPTISRVFIACVALTIAFLPTYAAKTSKKATTPAIVQGTVWNDTDGNPINAHGGGILYHNGKYYWYGEYKKGKTILPDWATWECYRTDVTGVSCYSSPDMVNWTFEGIVLPAVKDDKSHDLHPSKVLERPKVVYNAKTGKFVMWAHVESANYGKAAAGVAVSDSPTGPFKYLGSFRPNNAMSRDQTVFVDDDGKIYVVYHTRFVGGKGGNKEAHEVRVHQLFVNQDGWLIAAPYEYSGENLPDTNLTEEQMCGEYEFIVHNPKTYYTMLMGEPAGVVEPLMITLNQDGTVTGDATGTWTYQEGKADMTITVDGVEYKGYFLRQATEGIHKIVTAFTALGNNVCVWGSQK